MADVAASVLARLKNKAAKSGRSYQLCLQLFCQEEFLRRLEKSKYAENLVLKGGLFLYSLTDFDSRVTADVDFLLRKMPNTPEQLQAILEEIIATETGNDFITFEIKTVAPIAVAKKYAGIGASLVARIKNTKTPFGIDFGVGDIIVPRQEKRKIPTQLDGFEAPTVNTYSLETTVAEKLDAILSLMEFSSRMKDYYDLYYLANKFDFDGATLTEALQKTFENTLDVLPVAADGGLRQLAGGDVRQPQVDVFCQRELLDGLWRMAALPLKEDCLFIEPLFDLPGRQLLRWVNGFLPGVDALAVVVIAHGDHDEIAAAALADACHKNDLSFI